MKKVYAIFLALCIPYLAQAKPITIALDWYVNPDHGSLVLAKKLGYFKHYGLDVNLLEPADPTDPPKFLAIKKVDYAVNYQHVHQMQASQNWGNMRVATLVSSPLNSLVVLKKSGITNIGDLRNKTIGYSLPGFEDALLRTMLKTHGVDMSEVTLVNVNWALTQSLITGKVDAVIGAFRNFEKHILDIEGYDSIIFYPEDHGVPTYDELILATHKDWATNNTTKNIIRAIERATRYMKNYPEESWAIFKSYKPNTLDTALNKRAWFDTLRRFQSAPSALDYNRHLEMAQFLQDNALVKNAIPAVEVYAIDPFEQ